MQIYEGSPRQDWEEVLRSVGSYLDDRAMRGIAVMETNNGLVIQGTAVSNPATGSWGDSMGKAEHETLILDDDQIGKFMDDALLRRGQAGDGSPKRYELELRVIGRYFDEARPRDLVFFEVDGAYVARLTKTGQGGLKQELVEFTREDVADLIARAPALRQPDPAAKKG